MNDQDKTLDALTNEIEQGFMQRGGWKACRYLLGKLVGRCERERDDLARALFRIRSLTMRGKGDKQVADIACDAVRSIDETPLFEVAGAEATGKETR